MKHIWSVLCSRMVVDRESNNATLQNVLEQLTIRETPEPDKSLATTMDLGSLWIRDDGEVPENGLARVSATSPSGEVLGQWEMEIDLSTHIRGRTRLRFTSMPVPEPGIYWFTVEKRASKRHKWRLVAEVPLQISFGPRDDKAEEE